MVDIKLPASLLPGEIQSQQAEIHAFLTLQRAGLPFHEVSQSQSDAKRQFFDTALLSAGNFGDRSENIEFYGLRF